MAGSGRMVMSLEAALEEERQEIENLLLQGSSGRGPPSVNSMRSPSPYTSPRSPVRSMLDVGGSSNGARTSPPQQVTYRSMLDFDSPPPSATLRGRSMLDIAGSTGPSKSPAPSSAHTSPILTSHRAPVESQASHHRSMSDAANRPANFGPRSPPLPRGQNNDPTSEYQFANIYATNVGQALPGSKRTSQPAPRSTSIGKALGGVDLSSLKFPGEKGNRSYGMRSNSKSKSPNNRFSLRSNSPGASLIGNRNRNELSGTMMLDDGTILPMSTAYRKLSDTNLIYGGTKLGGYVRKKSDAGSHGRLERDNMSPYGEILPSDDSSDDAANSSDEEDSRGRKLTTRAESGGKQSCDISKTAKSLLAAAEDERKQIAAQPQYRSLFEPAITVTGPSGDRAKGSKGKQVIQPATSFDQDPPSAPHTPFDIDRESDVSAIKQAQKLEVSLTPIISNPEVHRSIRIIYRGAYNKIFQDAAEDHRTLRKYLVATDLSEESTHALEWAIGTVLRDGDTLIAIYCMDEEASGFIDPSSQVPDDPKSMREQAAVINAMAKSGKPPAATGGPSTLGRPSASPHVRSADGGSNTPSPAPSFRGRSRLEEERNRAVQDITDRVSKLLRKTQLQVRIIVECIHCKNPKHLITEVIDLVSPTLVILGSRGRSALKGTLLGSFSNYLVTKSSIPVMVARKRLRKKSKYQPPPVKQVNNLANPSARSLEMARVD